ncbi:MAG: hypothetical protein RIC55_30530 [Pirellulaceae bacterium]
MRKQLPTLAFLFAVFAAPTLLTAQTEVPVETLISRLGDDCYTVREQAYRLLAHGDESTLSALRAAADSQNLEIRCQAQRLTGLIETSLVQRRITAFLIGDASVDLPGWSRFRSVCGDDAGSREMFVAMMRAEPELWNAVAEDGESLSQAIGCRCEIIKTTNDYRRRRRASWATVCSMLFFSACRDVRVEYQVDSVIYNLANHGALDDPLADELRAAKVKLLLTHWVADAGSEAAILRFQLGYRFELKSCLSPALELIRGDKARYLHHKAMLVVAALGTRKHLADVAPLLEDSTILFKRADKGYVCQTRDAALLASLQLSGLRPEDFGFAHLEPNRFHLYQYNSIGFADPEKRAAAFAAWRKHQAGAAAKR